jgi:DNA-binding GntR family transcriptional regulator
MERKNIAMQNHPEVPKYWKLSQALREQIESGVFSIGARLPSEMQTQHGVSLSTANQACASRASTAQI